MPPASLKAKKSVAGLCRESTCSTTIAIDIVHSFRINPGMLFQFLRIRAATSPQVGRQVTQELVAVVPPDFKPTV
jgi:hypothetical protein